MHHHVARSPSILLFQLGLPYLPLSSRGIRPPPPLVARVPRRSQGAMARVPECSVRGASGVRA
eukprot:347029-Pyramimonas_sp.AAC.1